MASKTIDTNATKAYLSQRRAGPRINFYAVTNRWNPEKKRQDKSQIFLGSLTEGRYNLNEKADAYPALFLGTAHEDAYLAHRFKQRCLDTGPGARKPFRVERAGISILLDHIARDIPLWDCLREVFGQDNANRILSLAYYCLSETPIPLSRIGSWAAGRVLPSPEPITTDSIRQLFIEMDEASIHRFFSRWLETQPRENRLAFVLRPTASFGKYIADIMHGKKPDTEHHPRLRLLTIVDQHSLLPLWIEELPNSLDEKTSLMDTLNSIEQLDGTPAHIVFDRSFASEENFELLADKGIKFTMVVAFWNIESIQQMLDAAKRQRDFFRAASDLKPFQRFEWMRNKCVTRLLNLKKQRLHMHLYYTEHYKRQADALLNESIDRVKKLLEDGKPLAGEDKTIASTCFNIRQVHDAKMVYVKNISAIERMMDDDAGFYVIASTQFKDPFEAIIACELRDNIDAIFNDLINQEDCHRINVHASHNRKARLLVQFVAQVLRSHMRFKMNESKELMQWGQTISGTLWDIDTVLRIDDEKGHRHIIQTQVQSDILRFFGIQLENAEIRWEKNPRNATLTQ